MKQFFINILFGKPLHGKKINYDEKTVVKTTVPFNMPYRVWQHSVKEFGYYDLIRFIENYRKYKQPEIIGIPELS